MLDRVRALHEAHLWRSVELAGCFALAMGSPEPTAHETLALHVLVADSQMHTKQWARAIQGFESVLAVTAVDSGADAPAATTAAAPLPLTNDEMLERVSRCHRKTGHAREALDALERTSPATRSAHALRKMAQLQEELGNRKAACKSWMALLREHGLALEALEALVWLGASPTDLASFFKRDERKRRHAGAEWAQPLQLALVRVHAARREGRTRDVATELAALEERTRGGVPWPLLLWRAEREYCDEEWDRCWQTHRALAVAAPGLTRDADLAVSAQLSGGAVSASLNGGGNAVEALLRAQRAAVSLADAAPRAPETWLALAAVAPSPARALAYAERAAALAPRRNPVHARALRAQAGALITLGRARDALPLLAAAYGAHPLRATAGALEALVALRLAAHEPQEALRVAKQHYRAAPQSWRALAALGAALAAFPGAAGKAREVLTRALALGGPRAAPVAALAAVSRDESNPDGAVALLRRALGIAGAPGVAVASGPPEIAPGCLAASLSLRVELVRALLVRADEDRDGPWLNDAEAQLRACQAGGAAMRDEAARVLALLAAGAAPRAMDTSGDRADEGGDDGDGGGDGAAADDDDADGLPPWGQ